MDNQTGVAMDQIWIILIKTSIVFISVTIACEAAVQGKCTLCSLCKCRVLNDSMVAADCSRLKLRSVPKFSPNVTWINLSHNNIKVFPSRGELPSNIVYLDMSNNEITKFCNSSLRGLYSLQQLILQSNQLTLNTETYYPGLFKDLKNLKILNLKNNVRGETPGQIYPDKVFRDLVSLEQLHLDGLHNSTFDSGFANLRKLTLLDISGINGRCNLSVVRSDLFVNFPFLRLLDISVCRIIRIENGTFRNLSYLQELDISYNKDLTFAVAENVSYDMQFTDIRVIKAKKLHRTFGVGTQISTKDIRYLQNTSLEELYLDSNRIELIEKGALIYAPKNLTMVSFGDNKFTMGYYIFELLYMRNMKIINVSLQFNSHNSLEIFEDTAPGSCDRYVRSPCEDPYRSQPFRQQYKENYTKYGYTLPDLMLNVPPKLETIHFNLSLVRYTIPRLTFNATNEAKHLNFSGNILHTWNGPIKNLNKIKVLDLSNNYCSYVKPDFFRYLGSLQKLFIGNNLLGFMLFQDETGETFQNLTRLRELDLSQNRIHNLPRFFFSGLLNLTKLDLSGNLLRQWEFEISHMRQLKYIDLSQNQLFSIPNNILNDLDDISQDHYVSIDLYGNNILCKCETLKFLKWMAKSRHVKFLRFEKYQCVLTNGTAASLKFLENIVSHLELECSSKIGLIVAVLIGILVSVFAVTFGIIYRYRWKIRYLYYMARNKYSGYVRISNNVVDEYDYDAFVSYAEEDGCFVYNNLINNLELVEDGVTLCIHGRDFTPGLSIAANITKAINASRKTVIVLSRNFLRSEWCMYEFNMARMESIYNREGSNVLFIIFYENIPAGQLPLILLELIESKSYIEYPNDPQGNIVFWSKIKETIKSF